MAGPPAPLGRPPLRPLAAADRSLVRTPGGANGSFDALNALNGSFSALGALNGSFGAVERTERVVRGAGRSAVAGFAGLQDQRTPFLIIVNRLLLGGGPGFGVVEDLCGAGCGVLKTGKLPRAVGRSEYNGVYGRGSGGGFRQERGSGGSRRWRWGPSPRW
ncbi:hypothetical protein GCM10022247_73460 [Allokutzneria multivorans]|uniref:Uncharacterized protein n=1 Tax=Allokutzneria multivorans TaxID=1142134 RepID=A0ABP7U744_9PSEU